jgi:hypothetical protein
MKNKPSDRHGWAQFLRQQIHGKDSPDNLLELLKPQAEWRRPQSIIEDILHWADDDGQMLDIRNPIGRSDPDMARARENK